MTATRAFNPLYSAPFQQTMVHCIESLTKVPITITTIEVGMHHHQCQIEEKISQLILSRALFYIEELNSHVECVSR